ncbi:MAG: RraA family protein [Bryobacterales bacterium]|nr:RraA family protein [Bryobacterales bacterium]
MNIELVRERYLRLYSGVIGDALDKRGHRNQTLPEWLQARTTANRVAGVAFTGQGFPELDAAGSDMDARVRMLDSITPGTVSVWACNGSRNCAHWGELMSTAARERGCAGAVLDGGLRDTDFVNAMDYPVFAAFQHPASSIGRWAIKEWCVPVTIGATRIEPGDFIFGDADGVVVVPAALTEDVLAEAEDTFAREKGMREDLRRGATVRSTYEKYGSL